MLLAGPVLQALGVAVIMLSTAFAPYAAAASVFAAVMLFAHTFAFGLLARLEPSGRALAATPAKISAGVARAKPTGRPAIKNPKNVTSMQIARISLGDMRVSIRLVLILQ